MTLSVRGNELSISEITADVASRFESSNEHGTFGSLRKLGAPESCDRVAVSDQNICIFALG